MSPQDHWKEPEEQSRKLSDSQDFCFQAWCSYKWQGDRGSEGSYPSLGPLFEGESCIRETQNIKPKEMTAFELFTCLSTCLPCLSQTCGHPTADTLQVDFPIEILHLKTFNFDVFFRVQRAQMKDALRDVTTGEPQMTLGTEGWSRPVWRRWPFSQAAPPAVPCSLLRIIDRRGFHNPLSFFFFFFFFH